MDNFASSDVMSFNLSFAMEPPCAQLIDFDVVDCCICDSDNSEDNAAAE